jgi:mono/diheme cytochrome c family protein
VRSQSIIALFVVACASLLTACSSVDPPSDSAAGDSGPTSTGEPGPIPSGAQALYREPIAGGNSFTCETCHALQEPTDDGLTRPGHPIGDATRRPHWKNGKVDDLLAAVNSCLSEWMAADPWTASDADWLALRDWLDEQAPAGDAPALSFAIVEPPDVEGGDPEVGRERFNSSCIVCHGRDAVGTNKGPPLSMIEPTYAAQRIRTSGVASSPIYDGLTGGRMPFWAADRLSDQDVRDIAAWLAQHQAMPMGTGSGSDTDSNGDPTGGGTSGGPTDGDPTPGGQECPSTHERVGWQAQLSTLYHGVQGTAVIVDDCTVEIRDFHYDGTGIDVRIYGGQGGNYDDGFAMSDDLLKPGGYEGDTIVAKLPSDRLLDELDGVSVWCVDVGISFGEGLFAP